MRATLLVCLFGVLVWFVWHSFASGPDSALASEHAAGTMLAPEGSAGTPASAARETPSIPIPPPVNKVGSASKEAPKSQPPEAKPPQVQSSKGAAAPSQPVPAEPAPESSRTDLASELDLARAFVSEPQAFAALVATRSDLSRSRRDFALALAKSVTGGEAEARRLLTGLQEAPDVRVSEREFLTRCIDHRTSGLASASASGDSPLVRAAILVGDVRDADAARAAGKSKDAAQAYSGLLLEYVRAPWKPDPALLRRWSEALNATQRAHRWSKSGDWPSIEVKVEQGDSLIALRKRVVKDHSDLLLYTGQIERANQIKGAVIKPGQTLRIPTDRAHMLVDLDAHWAFYMLGDEVAAAWEVGVGQEGSATQVGTFKVGEKRKEQPMWFRAGKDPVPYGDPENPLGTRWIPWVLPDGQDTGLGFHGTNDPASVGKDQSQGCIRMRNAEVEELYDILPTGAVISVQP